MKYHAQFMIVTNNRLHEILGSDGVFILDGRRNLNGMICDTMMRMHKLEKIYDIPAYRIYKGGRFTDRKLIKEWICSGTTYNEIEPAS